jgi:hypothetical protein
MKCSRCGLLIPNFENLQVGFRNAHGNSEVGEHYFCDNCQKLFNKASFEWDNSKDKTSWNDFFLDFIANREKVQFT